MHPDVQLTWEQSQPPKRKGVGDATIARMFAPGGFVSGTGVGAWSGDRYQQVLRYTCWTYIAIKAIAETIAGMQPQVGILRGSADAAEQKKFGKKFLDPLSRRKALVAAQQSDEIEEVGPSHPLVKLLQNPNEPDVAWTFWYRTFMYLELTGNCYWGKYRNAFGKVVQMYVLPSHWVRPVGGITRLVDGYEIRPFGGYGGAKTQYLPADDVVHLAYPGPLSIVDGWSPLQAGSLWNDVAQSIDVSRLADMKQGTRARMLLALDPEFGVPDESVIDRMKTRVEATVSGETNSGRTLILEGGVVPHQINRPPAEMDYVDSSNQVSRDWIMAIHRVSKSIAGITEDVNYASMISSIAAFATHTVKPKMTFVGQVGTEKLAKEFGANTVLYWPDPTPPDPVQKNADITTDFACGAITPNEIRRERGREPYEFGGDDPVQPMANSPTGWATGDIPEPEPVNFEPGADSIDAPEEPPLDDNQTEEKPTPPINRMAVLLNGKH